MPRSDRSDREIARMTPAERLRELCCRVERLRPDYHAPHRFYEEKSEIAYELATLARKF